MASMGNDVFPHSSMAALILRPGNYVVPNGLQGRENTMESDFGSLQVAGIIIPPIRNYEPHSAMNTGHDRDNAL